MSLQPRAWRDDFLAAGYQPFTDQTLIGRELDVPLDQRMYQGSAQKAFEDARGTSYFISVNFYDFTRRSGPRSASAHMQFYEQDGTRGRCINVDVTVDGGIEDIEGFVHALWLRMGWGYYEVKDHSVPAANAAARTDTVAV